MKKLTLLFLSFTLACTLAACSSETSEETKKSSETTESAVQKNTELDTKPEGEIEDTKSTENTTPAGEAAEPAAVSSNMLVVYFSVPEDVSTNGVDAVAGASVVVDGGEVMGNTQYIANIIAEQTGADLFQIEPDTPYPTDHDPLVDYAADEQDDNARPAITNHIENLDTYHTIFVGYPNWWGDMPQILYTFFDEYDFSGKTIVPFNTHGGSGFSRTIRTIADMEPDATVIEDGYTVSRNNILKADSDVISWLEELGY